MAEVRTFFDSQFVHWDDKAPAASPKWDADVLATAMALALNDKATSGSLDPLSRKTLDRILSVQEPDGGFTRLKRDWP